MAPLAPIGRAKAMEMVARRRIPFDFGSPHPKVAIVSQDGVLRIRALVVDPEVASRARAAAMAAHGAWTPEMHYACGAPTGEIFIEAATVELLLAHMATMSWPADW